VGFKKRNGLRGETKEEEEEEEEGKASTQFFFWVQGCCCCVAGERDERGEIAPLVQILHFSEILNP